MISRKLLGVCVLATLPAAARAQGQDPYQAPPAAEPPAGYAEPAQPYGQPAQPYGQPAQPYGQPAQPGQYPPPGQPYAGYPPPAYYPPPQPQLAPGFHKHDGIYFRTHLGLGYMSMSLKESGSELKFSGMAGSFGLALGFALTENLIIFGELMDDVMSDPNVSVDGSDQGSANGSVGMMALGAGAAYYLNPANIYFSGTLASTWASVTDSSGDSYDSDARFGVNLMVGKEWWVSHDWGIGVAGQFLYATAKDAGVDISATAFTVALSATYN